MLEIRNLDQYFRQRTSIGRVSFRKFLKNISLNIRENEIVGIVGESGCGKTTLGKCIVGLINTYTGQILYHGKDIKELSTSKLIRLQMVFQNPRSSLNSNMTVKELITESVALIFNDPDKIGHRVINLISQMKLDGKENSFPYELSGGERRRVGLARIMAVQPDLIIADEPVSSLDVSIKGFIIKLMLEYRESHEASMVIITHDINLIREISNRIVVMYKGHIIEEIDSRKLSASRHPYTKLLLETSNYFSNPERKDSITNLQLSDDSEIIKGCTYQDHCPLIRDFDQKDMCLSKAPPLTRYDRYNTIACYYYSKDLNND